MRLKLTVLNKNKEAYNSSLDGSMALVHSMLTYNGMR